MGIFDIDRAHNIWYNASVYFATIFMHPGGMRRGPVGSGGGDYGPYRQSTQPHESGQTAEPIPQQGETPEDDGMTPDGRQRRRGIRRALQIGTATAATAALPAGLVIGYVEGRADAKHNDNQIEQLLATQGLSDYGNAYRILTVLANRFDLPDGTLPFNSVYSALNDIVSQVEVLDLIGIGALRDGWKEESDTDTLETRHAEAVTQSTKRAAATVFPGLTPVDKRQVEVFYGDLAKLAPLQVLSAPTSIQFDASDYHPLTEQLFNQLAQAFDSGWTIDEVHQRMTRAEFIAYLETTLAGIIAFTRGFSQNFSTIDEVYAYTADPDNGVSIFLEPYSVLSYSADDLTKMEQELGFVETPHNALPKYEEPESLENRYVRLLQYVTRRAMEFGDSQDTAAQQFFASGTAGKLMGEMITGLRRFFNRQVTNQAATPTETDLRLWQLLIQQKRMDASLVLRERRRFAIEDYANSAAFRRAGYDIPGEDQTVTPPKRFLVGKPHGRYPYIFSLQYRKTPPSALVIFDPNTYTVVGELSGISDVFLSPFRDFVALPGGDTGTIQVLRLADMNVKTVKMAPTENVLGWGGNTQILVQDLGPGPRAVLGNARFISIDNLFD